MVSLQKGQSVSLAKSNGETLSRVVMGLGWDVRKPIGLIGRLFGVSSGDIDLDASCLLFDHAGELIDSVWFRQLKSRDGSITHSGDNLTGSGEGDDESIRVELAKLPAGVHTLVFTVNSFRGDTFDRVEKAYCRVVDAVTNKELARYDLSGSGSHTGQVMARIVRTTGGWEFKALGERTNGRTFHDMMPAITAAAL